MSAAVTPLYVTISGEREQSEEVSYAPPERKFDLKFSILEIAPPTAIGLDERESHWKALLDSRNSGYTGTDMTELEYMASLDAVVTRWLHDRKGEPLRCAVFAKAERAQCHANAEAYVHQHGGQVIRGFLVQHPQAWIMVWVMPHSVVMTDGGLVDVTLGKTELHGLAFYPVEGDQEGFKQWAKRYPQETRPLPSNR